MATQQDYLEQDTHALVPVATYQTPRVQGFLMPLGDIAQARVAIDTYEKLKTAIVRDDDIQVIKVRGKDVKFLRKSFWRRVAACFGLSLEMVSEERLVLDGKLAYRATYRAIAPNGRIMDGDGMCTQAEKGETVEHNIRAIAHTRAKNRAISDLVGGGEVSAEEMQDEEAPRAAQSTHVGPVSPSQAFTPDVLQMSRNLSVLDLLKDIGIKDTTEQRAKLNEIRKWLGERGKAFDVTQVKALLSAQRARMQDGETVVTEVSLEDIDVGERGN